MNVSAAFECHNCARSGILPNTPVLDELGHRFCTYECAWSFFCCPAQKKTKEERRHLNQRVTPEDRIRTNRLYAANIQRAQQLQKERRLRRKARPRGNNVQLVLPLELPTLRLADEKVPQAPQQHHALFLFTSQLLGED